MKVCFIINALTTGGAERVFIAEANELSKRGHQVHMLLLFRRGELMDALTIPRENAHVVGMRSIFDIRGLFRALRIVQAIRPDTIYSTLNEANLVARFLALLMQRTRLITREANMADVKPFLYRLGDIIFGLRSSVVVGVSKAVADSVLSYVPHLKRRIRVLYNPVALPPEFSRASSENVRLLNVGSLTPKKDQAILIRAMSLLPANVTLTLVGDGQERSRLEALAHKLGVAPRITFVGAKSPEQVGEYYKNSDVFVLTSSREGCPNVVLEALSYRLPVVAFNIPGMAEFVRPEWGILVQERGPDMLAKAIARLASSERSRRGTGEMGFRHVSQNHSPKGHIDSLERLLTP